MTTIRMVTCIALAGIALLISSCNASVDTSDPITVKDTVFAPIKLRKLTSDGMQNFEAVSMINDTVYYFLPIVGDTTKVRLRTAFYFGKQDGKYHYQYRGDSVIERSFFHRHLGKEDFSFDPIGKPKVVYDSLPQEILDKLLLRFENEHNIICKKISGTYYFLDKKWPFIIFRYDEKTDQLITLRFLDTYHDVVGMIAKDWDGDGLPEFIMLYKGGLPREDYIECGFYSVTFKDTITVVYDNWPK